MLISIALVLCHSLSAAYQLPNQAPRPCARAQGPRMQGKAEHPVLEHLKMPLEPPSHASKQKRVTQPVFTDVCSHTGITLSRYMNEITRANPELRDLETLISSIQTACKTINSLVARAHITGMVGYQDGGGAINVQGEEQKRLDVVTNQVLKDALRFTGKMAIIASEEEDVPVEIEDENVYERRGSSIFLDEGAKYTAVFDPLDGSSNVDAGIPTGTIFGVFETPEGCEVLPEDCDEDAPEDPEGCDVSSSVSQACLTSTLQPGSALVASGYCLYSSSTFFTLTIGAGVQIFTLDPQIGEFILTHPNLRIPSRGNIYSMNEANRNMWDAPLLEYVDALQHGKGESGKQYTARYLGSMVGDVHRTLLYGGLFAYPADAKNPDGKLRLLYEAAPMAYLMEQAGGLALTGKTRVMDLMPKTVHQRVPIVCGSKDDVLECRKYYQASTDKELAKRCLSRLAPGQEITSLTSLVDLVAVDTNGDGQVDALVERKSEGG